MSDARIIKAAWAVVAGCFYPSAKEVLNLYPSAKEFEGVRGLRGREADLVLWALAKTGICLAVMIGFGYMTRGFSWAVTLRGLKRVLQALKRVLIESEPEIKR